MENFLHSKEYWSLVEIRIPSTAKEVELTEAQQKKTIADQKLKDLKVKNYLFQAIDRTIMEMILNRVTAKKKKKKKKNFWDSMTQKYQGSTRVKRAQPQALKKEFEVL